jgi:hypothetical protein
MTLDGVSGCTIAVNMLAFAIVRPLSQLFAEAVLIALNPLGNQILCYDPLRTQRPGTQRDGCRSAAIGGCTARATRVGLK